VYLLLQKQPKKNLYLQVAMALVREVVQVIAVVVVKISVHKLVGEILALQVVKILAE
jgi:hypothetical protein